jgi:tRNA dimethylallyltransferase
VNDRLVVLGPTASGKSDVAMTFAAARTDVEIVAVDAMQVYRRMDVGTAKPSAADRAAVPHHALDLAEPSDEFTVAEFVASAEAALSDIDGRGARAVLVAGTGLYLRALTDPMDMPGRWPDVRATLEERVVVEGSEVLHQMLTGLDPLAASRMEPANARRVVRALEVTLGSGRPFSSFGPGLDRHPPVPFVQIGLRWPRPALAERIAVRVHRMLADGLVDEVASLLAEPRGLSRTARQALGYKEIAAHLEGKCSLDEAVDTVILRTRQFAVRQERWFRRDPRVRWVDIEHDPVAEVLPILERVA